MPYRIFDSVLGSHSWSTDGRLCIEQHRRSESFQETVPNTDVEVLFTRLLHRSKLERYVHRAATRLHTDPSTPLDGLAAELGVSERYLMSGFQAAIGVDPHDFLERIKTGKPS